MDISHFELIFKPQAPAEPADLAAVDTVIQGYFLNITNLEDEEYQYRLEFVIAPPPVGTPDREFRSLAGNALTFVDTPGSGAMPGSDNTQGVLLGDIADSVFRLSTGLIRVPPGGTAKIAVLPSAFGCVPGDPTPLTEPNFEVRGYVRISLPALFDISLPPFFRRPQSDSPVEVLLTPQNRATYLTGGNEISDQTQASLPLASGQATNALDPEPGGPIFIPPVFELPTARLPQLMEQLPIAPADMLGLLLAQVDPDRSSLSALNKCLDKADIPLAIERSGSRKGRKK